mgnify:CR=1 FL=1
MHEGTLSEHPISIAPMMERTDRHYRYMMRLITRRTLLYTEMVTTGAIEFGDRQQLLGFDECEHPISLQLGGDDPDALYRSVKIAGDFGYDEYNINVGCPSDRVQEGKFGACLMARPGRVREAVEAMKAATSQPVTVKHRIGIDGRESYEEMREFVDEVQKAGPARFTVHARIAILGGLSPKENRTIPPLRYEDVYRLKQERPQLEIEINGGIKTSHAIAEHLRSVDAVMLGRAAYDTPFLLADVDSRYYGQENTGISRGELVEAMIPYMEQLQNQGLHPRMALRHMLELFAGRPGTRRYKQVLSGKLYPDMDVAQTMHKALSKVDPDVRAERPGFSIDADGMNAHRMEVPSEAAQLT